MDYPHNNARGVASAAHTLVSTLLKILKEPDIHTSTIGKVKECLNRMVIDLSHKTTVEVEDIFPFVYMAVYTFLSGGKPVESNKNEQESNESETEETSRIKTGKMDKSQSATKKLINKARINTSYLFQCNISI